MGPCWCWWWWWWLGGCCSALPLETPQPGRAPSPSPSPLRPEAVAVLLVGPSLAGVGKSSAEGMRDASPCPGGDQHPEKPHRKDAEARLTPEAPPGDPWSRQPPARPSPRYHYTRRPRPRSGSSCGCPSRGSSTRSAPPPGPCSPRCPGRWARCPARRSWAPAGRWRGRSPAGGTPRWRPRCPSRRRTPCPTSRCAGSPGGPGSGRARWPGAALRGRAQRGAQRPRGARHPKHLRYRGFGPILPQIAAPWVQQVTLGQLLAC